MLDRYDDKTKLIHYTAGGPWLPHYRNHPFGAIWFQYRGEAVRSAERLSAPDDVSTHR